jgi:hypothetical protein
MKKPVIGLAAVASLLVFAAAGAALTFNGTIQSTDPTQTGRVFFDMVASSCADEGTFQGATAVGVRHYDAHGFKNTSASSQCVTVTLTQTSGTSTQRLISVAYAGGFNPASPGDNWLADAGNPTAGSGTSVMYSFDVAAGASFIITVLELNENGCLDCTYTLDVNGTGVTLGATLTSARAARTKSGVLLRWHTGTEVDLLGFRVYRSHGQSWRRVGHSLIPAKGSVSGASYRFLDKTARSGVHYRYRIRAVNRDGTASWLASIRVT